MLEGGLVTDEAPRIPAHVRNALKLPGDLSAGIEGSVFFAG
jgi:hypothetical protein